VIRWDKNSKSGTGAWELGRQLRDQGYERVYLPHRSVRSALIAKLTGARERIGFADAPFLSRALYTETQPRDTTKHESERLLGLLGRERPSAEWSMTLTDGDKAKADAWMAANGVRDGFIALAPGSIWGTKRWPYYPELAKLLADRQVVVIGGKDDAALAEAILAAAPNAKNSAGQLSLRESAALIQRAAALVTNDSSPLHLATAVGTRVLAIFGSTVPAFGYGPIRPGDLVAEISLDCRPCSSHGPHVCPLGHHKCMRDQTPDAILRAIRQLLN
jgi:heptosyltransferase-2